MNIDKITTELADILAECSEKNWDGYEASPIRLEECNLTLDFVKKLPIDLETPEPCPEPNGYIGLEWYKNPGYVLSISVGRNGLVFAGIFEDKKDCGVFPNDGTIPLKLIEYIKQFSI